MNLSEKQIIILKHCNANEGKITFNKAVELLEHFYYSNASHYVSEVMGRLVKAGCLKRVKRGQYEIGNGARVVQLGITPANQNSLFDN